MHKIIYASGFLYNPHTQQILLQQQQNGSSLQWSVFGKKGQNMSEDPKELFMQAVFEQLHVKLAPDAVYPVYTYDDEKTGEEHHTFYATVANEAAYKNEGETEWFIFKQLTKLPLSPQTKHNIIVADRVIKAKARMDAAEDSERI